MIIVCDDDEKPLYIICVFSLCLCVCVFVILVIIIIMITINSFFLYSKPFCCCCCCRHGGCLFLLSSIANNTHILRTKSFSFRKKIHLSTMMMKRKRNSSNTHTPTHPERIRKTLDLSIFFNKVKFFFILFIVHYSTGFFHFVEFIKANI